VGIVSIIDVRREGDAYNVHPERARAGLGGEVRQMFLGFKLQGILKELESERRGRENVLIVQK